MYGIVNSCLPTTSQPVHPVSAAALAAPQAPAPPLAWMFLDMNSFFASVEQHLRPELRGHPVGVIPVQSDSTAVIAASHAAKKAGVKTGTKVADARRLCPDIRLVKARPDVYVKVHHAILRSVDLCAPVHKVYSIDEWAIRLMGHEQEPDRAMDLARRIKRQIYTDLSPHLSCSIGIAPTRLLAKIACDLQKPDGLTVLNTPDLPGKLASLHLSDLPGISDPMYARLLRFGIHTMTDLWNISRRRAIEVWGSVVGGYWWAGFHGVDEPELPTRKSGMGHANILEPRFRTEEGARGILARLVTRVGLRLRNEGYLAHHFAIAVSYTRGQPTFAADTALPGVQDTPSLLHALEKLWLLKPPPHPHAGAVPLKVSVQLSGLVLASQMPGFLFPDADKPLRLSKTVDQITRRWGLSAIHFGAVHGHHHAMDNKIAFGRIPALAEYP